MREKGDIPEKKKEVEEQEDEGEVEKGKEWVEGAWIRKRRVDAKSTGRQRRVGAVRECDCKNNGPRPRMSRRRRQWRRQRRWSCQTPLTGEPFSLHDLFRPSLPPPHPPSSPLSFVPLRLLLRLFSFPLSSIPPSLSRTSSLFPRHLSCYFSSSSFISSHSHSHLHPLHLCHIFYHFPKFAKHWISCIHYLWLFHDLYCLGLTVDGTEFITFFMSFYIFSSITCRFFLLLFLAPILVFIHFPFLLRGFFSTPLLALFLSGWGFCFLAPIVSRVLVFIYVPLLSLLPFIILFFLNHPFRLDSYRLSWSCSPIYCSAFLEPSSLLLRPQSDLNKITIEKVKYLGNGWLLRLPSFISITLPCFKSCFA